MITPEMIEAGQRAYFANLEHGSYAAMEAALTAALSAGWRPIESAPKDGTKILIFEPEGEIAIVSYVGAASYGDFPWKIWGGYSSYRIDVPTRWQPLPPPPEERKGE